MPDIQNMSYEESVNILKSLQISSKLNFKILQPVRVLNNTAQENFVISQSPPPGSIISSVTEISMVVCAGKETLTLSMPDFNGVDINDAEKKLSEMNLTIEKLQLYNRNKPANAVIKQEPQPGEKISENTMVKLYYNALSQKSGKNADGELKSKHIFFHYTTPNYFTPENIKIAVEDNVGERIIYNNIEPPLKQLLVKVNYTGPAKIKVYIQDRLEEIKSVE